MFVDLTPDLSCPTIAHHRMLYAYFDKIAVTINNCAITSDKKVNITIPRNFFHRCNQQLLPALIIINVVRHRNRMID